MSTITSAMSSNSLALSSATAPHARRHAVARPALQRAAGTASSSLQQQPQQPQRRQQQRAPGRRKRLAVAAVAAPQAAAQAEAASEYTEELEAAVSAVRLASRLCQASQSYWHCTIGASSAAATVATAFETRTGQACTALPPSVLPAPLPGTSSCPTCRQCRCS